MPYPESAIEGGVCKTEKIPLYDFFRLKIALNEERTFARSSKLIKHHK